jgi:hypothetical protein
MTPSNMAEGAEASASKVSSLESAGETSGQSGQATPAAEQPQIKVDDSRVLGCYANFCRVTGTPEEMIIDFALNAQSFGAPTEPVVVQQRLITNFYTAKRLWQALGMTLQRHEQTFGPLETNVQKRVQAR